MYIEYTVSGGQPSACLHQINAGGSKIVYQKIEGNCRCWGLQGRKIVGKDGGHVIRSEPETNERSDCSAQLRSGAGKDGC